MHIMVECHLSPAIMHTKNGSLCKFLFIALLKLINSLNLHTIKMTVNSIHDTVRAEIFAVVLFSRISRVKPSRKFPLQFMSIYSNDNISKIAKLTTRELPHLAKTAKITVRENNGVYSKLSIVNLLTSWSQFCFKTQIYYGLRHLVHDLVVLSWAFYLSKWKP